MKKRRLSRTLRIVLFPFLFLAWVTLLGGTIGYMEVCCRPTLLLVLFGFLLLMLYGVGAHRLVDWLRGHDE